ncbi:hypothetical protein E2C01_086750 [Portunus trituberculatus]|uniref:Uncharacterized protein n=1 Tax=Portunus trituberculatus TaxID=210409 RepID=A0A5B7JH67_PORTR|nr:hypothetical protein [Portunus trituberculatus]
MSVETVRKVFGEARVNNEWRLEEEQRKVTIIEMDDCQEEEKQEYPTTVSVPKEKSKEFLKSE